MLYNIIFLLFLFTFRCAPRASLVKVGEQSPPQDSDPGGGGSWHAK